MADFIIIAVLATAVFFILRSRIGKLRKGQCAGGCPGCPRCAGCSTVRGAEDSAGCGTEP